METERSSVVVERDVRRAAPPRVTATVFPKVSLSALTMKAFPPREAKTRIKQNHKALEEMKLMAVIGAIN